MFRRRKLAVLSVTLLAMTLSLVGATPAQAATKEWSCSRTFYTGTVQADYFTSGPNQVLVSWRYKIRKGDIGGNSANVHVDDFDADFHTKTDSGIQDNQFHDLPGGYIRSRVIGPDGFHFHFVFDRSAGPDPECSVGVTRGTF